LTELLSNDQKYPDFGEITQDTDHYAFKVIQDHRFRYQWKARMRLPMCE